MTLTIMNKRKMQKLKNKPMDASPGGSSFNKGKALSVADKVLTDNGSGENQYCSKNGRNLRIKQIEASAPVGCRKDQFKRSEVYPHKMWVSLTHK